MRPASRYLSRSTRMGAENSRGRGAAAARQASGPRRAAGLRRRSAVPGRGDVAQLALSVTPHADAGALSWSLVLPPGAELLEGPAAGTLAAGSAGTGPLVVRVKLPPGGAQVALNVEGVLAPSAGPTAASH